MNIGSKSGDRSLLIPTCEIAFQKILFLTRRKSKEGAWIFIQQKQQVKILF